MAVATYLPEAEADLHGIWLYVYRESGSLPAADRWIAKIAATAATYATHPLLRELRPDLADRGRCFHVSDYVVFYVPGEDGIEVIQVIHGARDIPAHFRKPR